MGKKEESSKANMENLIRLQEGNLGDELQQQTYQL